MTYTQVYKFYGNANKAAEALGFTRAAISLWKTRGIPKRTQKLIQAISGGELKAAK